MRSDRACGIPLCGKMLLSEAEKRSEGWCCIVALTLVTGIGQSLHHIAGIEHDCECSQPSETSLGHFCEDSACPFESTHSHPAPDDPVVEGRSCSQSADGCSVCRLLSHLGNGFFFVPEAGFRQRAVGLEPLSAEAIALQASLFVYAPRGPPATG